MKEIEDKHVGFSIFYALGQLKLPALKRRFDETERAMMARAVLDHFRLARWRVMHEPETWHSVRYGTEK
jgi:hypothetical protein